MDPLPIQVIRESNSVKDIPAVALQMRSEYTELRDWLGLYQNSINSGNYRDIQKYQKILMSISKYVDSVMGKSNSDEFAFTAGINILKVAIKGDPVNTLQNQFGVRAMINKLIVGESGEAELRKLLRFFGHRNSSDGMKVINHFSVRNAV